MADVKVFVSHSHADDAFTAQLVSDLRAVGAEVWVDTAEITYDDFLRRINEGLSGSQWLVLVLSQQALESKWVQIEVNAAINATVRGRMRGVIPLIAADFDIAAMPSTWDTLHRYDARRDYAATLSQLLRVLSLPLHASPLPQVATGGPNPAASLRQSPGLEGSGSSVPARAVVPAPAAAPRVPPARPAQMGVFAIANQRGGVGKTTTAVNLAASLAESGMETLVVDCDPLCDATVGLGLIPVLGDTPVQVDQLAVKRSIYDLLVDDTVSPDQVVKKDLRPHLSVMPAHENLYAAEIELAYFEERELRLKRRLDAIQHQYDFVLLDCPSSLGLLTVNAMTAADGVILPLKCEYFALASMAQLLKTIKVVRDRLNPRLDLFGVLLTMFDSRTKLATEVVDEITHHFTREKFKSIIPSSVRMAEAPTFGKTILEHDPRNAATVAYKALAEEVIARVKGKMPARG